MTNSGREAFRLLLDPFSLFYFYLLELQLYLFRVVSYENNDSRFSFVGLLLGFDAKELVLDDLFLIRWSFIGLGCRPFFCFILYRDEALRP